MSPHRWQAIWARRQLSARLLWPIAAVYGVLVGLRRRLYQWRWLRIHRLPVPVVVVGNVVVGGAGKTPAVIALIEHLRARGWRPGVISRGYGRQGRDVVAVEHDTPAHLSGDEPALIHRRTGVPVFVAARRADAGRALLAAHPEVNLLLCDDGLQHWALARDVALAIFDERGSGNGWLLPAGLLREPWPPRTGTPFAPDLLLVQHSSGTPMPALPRPAHLPCWSARRQLSDTAWGPHGATTGLQTLARQPVTALAGIARPEAFFAMLRARGLRVARTCPLPDHATEADYRRLPMTRGEVLVCTEKDAVKLFACLPPGVTAWAIPLVLQTDTAFWTALDTLLAQRASRAAAS